METEKRRKLPLIFLLLHASLLFNSLSGVTSKMAANEYVLSGPWILFFGLTLLIMFLYAIVWQQILKRLPLSVAYANKPIGLVWAMVWGALIFGEKISWNMIVGAGIIFIGICVVVTADG